MANKDKHAYVLSVMADDHPGIVSTVSSVIESLSGNIDSCSQTVLGGYFTLIMLVSIPKLIDPAELSEKIHQANPDFQVSARQMVKKETPKSDPNSDSFVITAFGKDIPGIVSQFSAYLADREINIGDLYCDRRGENEFVLIGQVSVPNHWNLDTLQSELAYMGKELGFTVKLQQQNIFLATNQIRLPKN